MRTIKRWWNKHTYHEEGSLCFKPWWLAPIFTALVCSPFYGFFVWRALR